MPLYEYRCQKCGHRVEVIQKFSDPPLKRCSECRGKLNKVIAPPALQFKGSGWYITDYSDKGKADKLETTSKDTSKQEGKKESASDSKTDGEKKPVAESAASGSSDSKESKPAPPKADSTSKT